MAEKPDVKADVNHRTVSIMRISLKLVSLFILRHQTWILELCSVRFSPRALDHVQRC